MAPRKSNGRCRPLVLLHVGNGLITLSLIAIVTAYTIRRNGFVTTIWNRSLTDTAKDNVESHSIWTFLTWTAPSEDVSRTNFHQVHPVLFQGVQWLDFMAEKSFSAVDLMTSSIYSCLCVMCSTICDTLRQLLQSSVTFFSSLHLNSFSNSFSHSFGILTLALILVCLSSLVLLFCCLRRLCRGQSRSTNIHTDRQASIGMIAKTASEPQSAVHRRPRVPVKRSLFVIVGLFFLLSIPWEFVRIYQAEVARKAAITLKGTPTECIPGEATLWQSLKAWWVWQFSWSADPCEEYHKALLVDPLWEVTPILVLSTLLSRCVTSPLLSASSSLGSSLRLLLREIPAQWQPVVMVTITALLLVCLVIRSRYRVSMPLFFRVEPSIKKTPVIVPRCRHKDCLEHVKNKYTNMDILSTRQARGDTSKDIYSDSDYHEEINLSQVSDISQTSVWDL